MKITFEWMHGHLRRPSTNPVYRVTIAGGKRDPWKVSYLLNQVEFDEMKTSMMEADNNGEAQKP